MLSSTALTTATNMLPANSAFVNLRRLLAKGPAAGGTLTRTISACPPDHSKFAAPLLNKPTPAREIGGCPPEYSRMAARVHKCNTKLPHVSASYSDEELMANIWTRAIARNGRPSRHRCAALVAHSPRTRSAHPRNAHPLARSPAHPLPRCRVHGDFCAKCGMIGCTSSSCATTSVEIMSIPRIPHLCSDVDWECGVSGEQQLRY